MRFRNMHNGFEEEVRSCWLWSLALGPIYFIAKGIWPHVVLSLVLAISSAGLSWLVYPFFTEGIVRRYYLRLGWADVTAKATYEEVRRRYVKAAAISRWTVGALGIMIGAVAFLSAHGNEGRWAVLMAGAIWTVPAIAIASGILMMIGWVRTRPHTSNSRVLRKDVINRQIWEAHEAIEVLPLVLSWVLAWITADFAGAGLGFMLGADYGIWFWLFHLLVLLIGLVLWTVTVGIAWVIPGEFLLRAACRAQGISSEEYSQQT